MNKVSLDYDLSSSKSLGKGTFGEVIACKHRETGEEVAIKFFQPSSKLHLIDVEIRALHALRDEAHVVSMLGCRAGASPSDSFIAFERCPHTLEHLISQRQHRQMPQLNEALLKNIMFQLLAGVDSIHRKGIIHSDLKPANILIDHNGKLKICDFGQAIFLPSDDNMAAFIPGVTDMPRCSLTYRAPERIMGQPACFTANDMWAVGCIMGELLVSRILFAGQKESKQMQHIYNLLGSPSPAPHSPALGGSWPLYPRMPNSLNSKFHCPGGNRFGATRPSPGRLRDALRLPHAMSISSQGQDLLLRFLSYNPERRITASEALKHPWFHSFPHVNGLLPRPKKTSKPYQ